MEEKKSQAVLDEWQRLLIEMIEEGVSGGIASC